MKPQPILLALLVALSACAPARTPPPMPEPIDAREQPEVRPTMPPPEPQQRPEPPVATRAPDRWWMLDRERDGVYGAGVDRAYAELLAGVQPRRTVVVAIIDSGIDVEHDDLRANLWLNDGERRNGRDDDGNGYIDDVHGWNFIGGADGDHVKEDTYEVTRLYASCRMRFADADSARLPAPQQVEYGRCSVISDAYYDKREETEQMLPQIRQMNQVVTQVVQLLRQQLGTDSLTRERVRALTPLRSEVFQAQQIWLQLNDNDITPAMIERELERLEGLMEKGLNPEFDPRPIVGDDYTNATQRVYGNADVTGPDASHGTGVAGIVGAVRGNDLGVDGIAPAVRLMAIRAVPDGDERDKDVANAIRYAVDNGAHIINMSFGKGFSPEKAVVDAAVRHADERGVLLVHAAGNDGNDLAVEENYPNRTYLSGDTARLWLEVGASSWRGPDRLAASFSNYGRWQVDLFAPGDAILSTAPGSTYESASGTSFAAPVVSGVAALIMAYHPELTAADVRRIILETVTPLGDRMVVRPGTEDEMVRFGELSVTGGIVNAHAALRRAAEVAATRAR
jgi:subtilisin family serine protease